MATKHIKAGTLAAQTAAETCRRREELNEKIALGGAPLAGNRAERRWLAKRNGTLRAPISPQPLEPIVFDGFDDPRWF